MREGVVGSVDVAKDERKEASTSWGGCAQTGSRNSGPAVASDSQAASGAEETSQ